jgi:hypothetical protein
MLRFLRLMVLLFLVLIAVSTLAALVYQAFHYLRGRRDREQGLPCIRCERTAFPVGGTVTRYRCWNCGFRFDGPEHF